MFSKTPETKYTRPIKGKSNWEGPKSFLTA